MKKIYFLIIYLSLTCFSLASELKINDISEGDVGAKIEIIVYDENERLEDENQ